MQNQFHPLGSLFVRQQNQCIAVCLRCVLAQCTTWSAREVDNMLISSLSAVNLHICSHRSFRSRSNSSRITPKEEEKVKVKVKADIQLVEPLQKKSHCG